MSDENERYLDDNVVWVVIPVKIQSPKWPIKCGVGCCTLLSSAPKLSWFFTCHLIFTEGTGIITMAGQLLYYGSRVLGTYRVHVVFVEEYSHRRLVCAVGRWKWRWLLVAGVGVWTRTVSVWCGSDGAVYNDVKQHAERSIHRRRHWESCPHEQNATVQCHLSRVRSCLPRRPLQQKYVEAGDVN